VGLPLREEIKPFSLLAFPFFLSMEKKGELYNDNMTFDP
jgi:hypothetical protein